VERREWHDFVEELRTQWRTMWRDRIDDKLRAEGIADKEYSPLFVECGTVIAATREYKPPDFVEILEQHKTNDIDNPLPPTPAVGGWRKFARTVLSKKKRSTTRGRPAPSKPRRDVGQQRKKGGKGWLHYSMT
jgi:hypothetical protein